MISLPMHYIIAKLTLDHLAFWFGWYVFFPNTLVYEREEVQRMGKS